MRSLRLPLSLLILLLSSFTFAQRTGTFGGGTTGSGRAGPRTSDLQISVRYQNDRPIQGQVHVQLLNAMGIKVGEAFANSEGVASFSAVRAASYRVRVDGADIQETTTEPFQVQPSEGVHSEWVRVTPKAGTNSTAGGTISTQDLNIPPQARKQLDKGTEAMTRGDLQHAEELFLKATEIYPAYTRAWNNVGVVRMKAGNRSGAMDAWNHILAIDDKFAPAYFNLARLSIADNRPEEAEQLVQKGLVSDPQDASGIVLLASVYEMEQQWEKSVATARRAHELTGKPHPDAHLIAADALLHQGMGKEAIAEYSTYLQEFPDSPHAEQVRNAVATIEAKLQANGSSVQKLIAN